MTVRFLHTSDLHIGKRFGNLPEDLRGRLREARHTAIDRLAAQARAHNTDTVLLAGDTFDTETPSPQVLRQALAAIGGHADLRWVILPGNHDSLAAEELWDQIRRSKPDNLLLAHDPEPLWLSSEAVVLPAACTARRPGRDLTAWMEDCDTDAAVRIGLAHGAIQNFSEDGTGTDIIAPNRASLADLDYLALGDWHGLKEINAKTWYSGTPEPDRFKHNRPGQALIVSIAGRGATPEVTAVDTGVFEWRTLLLELFSGDDPAERLDTRLPPGSLRRQVLLRVAASGHTTLPGRTALTLATSAVEPEFAYVSLDDDQLTTDCDTTDLELIDHAGALREAAQTLLAETQDPTLDAASRTVARDALVRLFTYCEAIQA